jgi:hypothetical protein
MAQWYAWLARGLVDHVGDKAASRAVLAKATAQAFERRYAYLRTQYSHLPDTEGSNPRAVGLAMHGLYVARRCRRTQWMLSAVGGPFGGPRDRLAAWRLVAPMSVRRRWEEVATHLGEVLIALTENLAQHGVPNPNRVLGQICFDAGARYGARLRDAFGLARTPDGAIEILRQGEYIFRVNPEHWTTSDAQQMTGSIEGTACPWYVRPGWRPMHCGIFGRFQAGVSSEFDLRYTLTKTIPRHGGHSCRIDLTPIGEPRSPQD